MDIRNMAPNRGGMQQAASWFFRSSPTAEMRIRLFCFPCAGYGAAMYRAWQSQAPAWLEIVPVQPPGRANRLAERFGTCLRDRTAGNARPDAPLSFRTATAQLAQPRWPALTPR